MACMYYLTLAVCDAINNDDMHANVLYANT